MTDQFDRGEGFEKKAEKKLKGWAFLGPSYDDAADLYEKAANSFKLAKSWDRAGLTYIKLADCYVKLDSKHEAANAYVDGGHCYKKSSIKDSIACLERATNMFIDIGRFNMSARYCKEIAELYESEHDYEHAISYYERAAELFQTEEATSAANQCKLKIAQYASLLERYPKAIEIYEEIAQNSIGNNLLKYSVKGYLLNAGICELCRDDMVAITNALARFQNLDLTFSKTREYKFLSDLAAALDESDVGKYTDVVKEFDAMTSLDNWKTTLLLRVKESIKAKEMDDGEDLS